MGHLDPINRATLDDVTSHVLLRCGLITLLSILFEFLKIDPG